jgi:hypothetical protein
MSPLEAEVDAPVPTATLPLDATDAAVETVTSPLDPLVLAPLCTCMAPPVPVEEAPPDTRTSPPAQLPPD